jgi:hypothetical protein
LPGAVEDEIDRRPASAADEDWRLVDDLGVVSGQGCSKRWQ